MAKRKRRTRMPSPTDCDEFGMIRMQVKTKQGMKVRRVPAVDAREIILSESGTLDIDPEVSEEAVAADTNLGIFMEMGLDELRALCKENDLSYTGKPVSAMARMLLDAGVEPPDEEEEDED